MAGEWIVKRGEQQRGPFTSQQLKSLASSGKLKPTDLVGKADGGSLQPAGKVKGLFAAAEPTQSKRKPTPVEDEYGTVEEADSDDYGDGDDYEADPPPACKKRPPGAEPRKKSSSGKSKGKGRKRSDEGDSEDADNGDGSSWANLAWGTACLGLGIVLFVTASNAEASGQEIDFGRKGGLFKMIYGVLGKWGVLAFFVLASLLFFGSVIAKWSKRR
jgi:hypothetical protein